MRHTQRLGWRWTNILDRVIGEVLLDESVRGREGVRLDIPVRNRTARLWQCVVSEEVLEDSELGAQAEQTRRALSPGGDGTLRGPCGVRLYSRSEREYIGRFVCLHDASFPASLSPWPFLSERTEIKLCDPVLNHIWTWTKTHLSYSLSQEFGIETQWLQLVISVGSEDCIDSGAWHLLKGATVNHMKQSNEISLKI